MKFVFFAILFRNISLRNKVILVYIEFRFNDSYAQRTCSIERVFRVLMPVSYFKIKTVLFSFSRANVDIPFKVVESICNSSRREALPKNAANVPDILEAFGKEHILETYGYTYRPKGGERSTFLKYAFECDEFSYCIFASDDIVKMIEENVEPSNRKLYSDATFKVTPIGVFRQVLVLHCDLMGFVRIFLHLFILHFQSVG